MDKFSALLALCAGNSPVLVNSPAQRPVTRSFDVFFDLRPNEQLSKQREAGDLKCHRGHYDVIVMAKWQPFRPGRDELTFKLMGSDGIYISVLLLKYG